MKMDAKRVFLEQFPLFSYLNESEKSELAELAEHRVIAKHGMIYQPGQASDTMYFLLRGAVKIGTHSNDGKEVIKALVHPLAMFGELGLIGEEHRKDFAQVLKDNIQVLCIKVLDFKRMMRDNFDLCNRVMMVFGSRLMQAEEKLESLIFKDARTRIVEFIRDSVNKRGQRIGYEMLLKHSLTHQDIANITCTSRQTVTLVLNELKKSELIHFNRGRILVRDMASLT
jgi:CRP/FNR family transcriptional regulator, cyclic AMP receptor protein